MPYIHSDGVRLAYDVIGQGAAVVLLHSTASSSAQWGQVRRALAERFTVVAVDLFGYGASDPWPAGLPARLEHEAAAVACLLDRFEGPPHLVGHSYGGAVALKLALSGRSLASLTMVEPVAFHLLRDGSDLDRSLLQEIVLLSDGIDRSVASGAPAAAMERFVDYWNGPGTWAEIDAERRAGLCRLAGAVTRNFAAALGDGACLTDCAFLFTPVLLMAGDRTTRPAARIAARLAATLPSVDFRLVEGAGHMLTRTHPNTFLQALLVHLDRWAETQAETSRRSAA